MLSFNKDLFVGLSRNSMSDFNKNHIDILPESKSPNLKELRSIYLQILEIESNYADARNKYSNNPKFIALQQRIEDIKSMISKIENK